MKGCGHIVFAAALALVSAGAASAANTIGCWKVIASQPCTKYIVGDTEAGLPSSGVPEGVAAWPKDTDRLVCYYGGSWQPCNSGSGGDPTLGGDVDGAGSANDLDEAAVESELEGVLDLQDLQGAVTDSQVPDGITVTLAATATALAANPADCSTNQFATTISASGALTCAALVDADIPNTITVDLATAATSATSATTAATATALAANPTACTAGDFVTDIAADGTLTCATPASGGLTQPQIMARLALGGGY